MKKLFVLLVLSLTLFSCQKEQLIYTEKANMKNIESIEKRPTQFNASNSNETSCEAWSDVVDQLLVHNGDNDYPEVGDLITDMYSGNPVTTGWYKMGNGKVIKVIPTKAGSLVELVQVNNPC